MLEESAKHGIKRLILFLVLPCKIFVALAGLDNDELATEFQWSLLGGGLLATNCILCGFMVAAIVKVGLLQAHSSYAL